MLTFEKMPHTVVVVNWIQLKITFFKKKLLKRLYIKQKKEKKKKKLNATLIDKDIKVEIHGIAYDLTHLDNLK